VGFFWSVSSAQQWKTSAVAPHSALGNGFNHEEGPFVRVQIVGCPEGGDQTKTFEQPEML